MWNQYGNFDRVSSLGMLLWHDATTRRQTEKRREETKGFLDDPYWDKMGVKKKKPFYKGTSSFYN
ncbi:MAG TPA: hypothetical protein DEG69_17290 [Flavobacteriaceae bacterium]|nr:hypothetical protein [Flavobacteriaceae bacterium]